MKHKRQTHHRDGSGGGNDPNEPGGFEPLEGADASSPYSSQPLEASGTGESESEQGSSNPSSAAYASDSGDNAQSTTEEGGLLACPDRQSLHAVSGSSATAATHLHPLTTTNSSDNQAPLQLNQTGPEPSFSDHRDSSISSASSALPDLTLFATDACLSPSLQSSLDSPVDFSEEDFDLFTSTLCTIDLQHLNFWERNDVFNWDDWERNNRGGYRSGLWGWKSLSTTFLKTFLNYNYVPFNLFSSSCWL